MKLRYKVHFYHFVTNPTETYLTITKECEMSMVAITSDNRQFGVNFESYLHGKQARKIKPNPSLVIQFANFIANVAENQIGHRPKVLADVSVVVLLRNISTLKVTHVCCSFHVA
jgi:hypothetical protein